MAMRVLLVLVCLMVPPLSFAQGPPSRPLGTWERRLGLDPIFLHVEESRLHLIVPGDKACTVHADYGMTKDGVIFGLVTSVEAEGEMASMVEKELLEQTFRCRFRLDEGALVISEVKIGNLEKQGVWGGRFKRVAKTANGCSRPKVEQLLAALNANARRIKALRCDNVAIDLFQQGKTPLGLDGVMVVRRPHDFRLRLRAAGVLEADFGSGSDEVWCWIHRANPPWAFRAKHKDLAAVRAKMPLIGYPGWFVQVLGVGESGPAKDYEVAKREGHLVLIQKTKEPDGSHLRRIIILKVNGKNYEPVAYRLEDAQGKALCLARIVERVTDPATGASLPTKLTFTWPANKSEMKVELHNIRSLPSLDPEKAKLYFTRPQNPG